MGDGKIIKVSAKAAFIIAEREKFKEEVVKECVVNFDFKVVMLFVRMSCKFLSIILCEFV